MFKFEIENSIPEVSHKLIKKPDKSVYFNHIHNHCEILLFISGEAEYVIDGKIFNPSPYDILFIPAATYHYLNPTATIPYENYVIGINPENIDSSHYNKLFSPPLMLSIKEDNELKSFFTRLDFYAENYSKNDFDKSALHLIHELVTYCSYQKNNLDSANSGSIALIEDIIKYITENIEKPLDADIISHHFSLSKSYVQNAFSQNMHIGIKAYIMQKKIYSAHNDLLKGNPPIEVCEKYAFGDYSSFYRLNKKTFGVSPRKKWFLNKSKLKTGTWIFKIKFPFLITSLSF